MNLNEDYIINTLAYNKNEFLLATGSNNGNIKIRTINRYITSINTSFDVFSLAILQNGNIVSGFWEGNIKIWNSTSYELITPLEGHKYAVFDLLSVCQ